MYRKVTKAIVFTLLLTLSAPLLSSAATPSPTATITQASLQEHRHIRALTASALAQIAHAQQTAGKKDIPQTLAFLTRAQALLDDAQASRPNAQVLALSAYFRLTLTGKDNTEALAGLLPIYRALADMGDSRTVTDAHAHLDEAKNALENQQRDKVLPALQAMDAGLSTASIDFPLRAAQDELTALIRHVETHHGGDDKKFQSVQTQLLSLLSGLNSAPGR